MTKVENITAPIIYVTENIISHQTRMMYLHLHVYLIAIYFKLPSVENT